MTMRRAIVAAVILFPLAGCSSTPAAEPSPSETKRTIPQVTDVQSKDLIARIAPIVPKQPQPGISQKARYVCSAILQGGSQKALDATAIKHFALPADPVTAEEAARIVAAVKANGFCK